MNMGMSFEQKQAFREINIDNLLKNRAVTAVVLGAGRGAVVGAYLEARRQREDIVKEWNGDSDTLIGFVDREIYVVKRLNYLGIGTAALTGGAIGAAEAYLRHIRGNSESKQVKRGFAFAPVMAY